MSQLELKKQAAQAALRFIEPGQPIGIGTGSTVNCFIDQLGPYKDQIRGAVSSSEASTEKLQKMGIEVLDLNTTGPLSLYVDGADEFDQHCRLIKGGGGALTREKIIAASSNQFVCIVDESKQVDVLGEFPLPVEVIPMARGYVARKLTALGGQPVLRQGMSTDNGNQILDIHQLKIIDPIKLEQEINHITGVVTVGLFAGRPADRVIIASPAGIREIA